MNRNWIAIGALCGALAVMAGAFGAHGLAERLDARSLGLWETAARYLMYSALAQLAVGLLVRQGVSRADGAGWCFLVGGVLFSGSVFALALGGPRIVGAVTPLGGLLLIGGFLALGWVALRAET
ncbi:MAG TPA: DUF423 domain-containing protein [Thermoanaerobaculia bacterium]